MATYLYKVAIKRHMPLALRIPSAPTTSDEKKNVFCLSIFVFLLAFTSASKLITNPFSFHFSFSFDSGCNVKVDRPNFNKMNWQSLWLKGFFVKLVRQKGERNVGSFAAGKIESIFVVYDATLLLLFFSLRNKKKKPHSLCQQPQPS